MIQTLPYPASWHPFLKYIGENPGTDTKAMAAAMPNFTADQISKSMYSIWTKQDKATPVLLRQQMERPVKSGGRNQLYYRFFTPENCPAYLRDDLLAFLRGTPLLASEEEVAAPTRAIPLEELLRYVYAYPGCTAVEIATALNGEPSRVAGALLHAMNSKRQPGRLDRVPDAPSGRSNYRWYHPNAVPADADSDLRRARAAEAYKAEHNAQAEAQDNAQAEVTPAAVGASQPTEPPSLTAALGLPENRQDMALLHLSSVVDEFVGRTADAIVAEVRERLLAMVATQMEAALADLPGQIVPAASNAIALAQASKPRRPKVVVIGIKSEQKHILRAEFADTLRLDCFEGCQGADKMRDSLAYANHAVLMTKFINHSHTSAVKKANVPFTYVDGGMDALRHVLRVQERTAVAA